MIDNRGLWIAAASAAVLGITLLVGPQLVGKPASDQARLPGEATARPTAPTTAGLPTAGASIPSSPVPSSPVASQSAKPPAPPWQPVATAFARDFTNPGTGHADWLARVSRWTSDYLTSQYQRTDEHRIPVASLTGIMTVTAGETTVDFRASYNTGLKLDCRAELGPTGWRVTRAQPAGSA